jgi:hypothetical protein
MKRTGLPSASTAALIFVLRPPRERQIASSSLPLLRPLLARAHDGGVDDRVFKVWILDQCIENALPHALLGPAAKALEYAVPVAELFRQVAPWRTARANQSTASTKQALVLAMSPFLPGTSRSMRRHCASVSSRRNQDRPPQS